MAPPRRFDDTTEAAIVQACENGAAMRQLARDHGCSLGTIQDIVTRHDAANGTTTKRGNRGGFDLLEHDRLSRFMSNKTALELYTDYKRGIPVRVILGRYPLKSKRSVYMLVRRVEEAARRHGLDVETCVGNRPRITIPKGHFA